MHLRAHIREAQCAEVDHACRLHTRVLSRTSLLPTPAYPLQQVKRTFVRSVAVHSMNTLRVASEIFECSPLMRGGRLHTVRLASRTTGYTGLRES